MRMQLPVQKATMSQIKEQPRLQVWLSMKDVRCQHWEHPNYQQGCRKMVSSPSMLNLIKMQRCHTELNLPSLLVWAANNYMEKTWIYFDISSKPCLCKAQKLKLPQISSILFPQRHFVSAWNKPSQPNLENKLLINTKPGDAPFN